MTKQDFLKEGLGWGIGLWMFGYVLGFIFFPVVSTEIIGWYIMPFGVLATLWVLFKKINNENINHYFYLGIIWTIIAVIFDYFFLVKLLNPTDGYYKLDVYLYYILTLILPLSVGMYKSRNTTV